MATRSKPDIRALILLSQKKLSASGLARAVGVSVITAKRIVAGLRKAGHEIASVRWNGESYYEVREAVRPGRPEKDPLITTVIPRSRTHPPRGKKEDSDYDLR
jgi:biotin operon repressor